MLGRVVGCWVEWWDVGEFGRMLSELEECCVGCRDVAVWVGCWMGWSDAGWVGRMLDGLVGCWAGWWEVRWVVGCVGWLEGCCVS